MDTTLPNRLNIGRFILIFLAAAALGAFLLCLPFASRSGVWTSYFDNLFNAISAVSVTGLFVFPVTYYSIFGQIIILLLIQLGGLGIMTFATVMFFVFKKRLSLKDRLAVSEIISTDNPSSVKSLLLKILLMTLINEAAGFLLLLIAFVPDLGAKGIFTALFMSVSAFCNAGVDILEGATLSAYSGNIVWLLSSMALIVFGGLGFSVIIEIFKKKRFFKLSIHSKIVILATLFLISVPAIVFAALEWNNPSTLGCMAIHQKIFNALFLAVSPRSAGFAAFDMADLTPASQFITSALMIIGASPASTGGGIKTTTLVILAAMVISGLKGDQKPVIFGRGISQNTTARAVTVLIFFIAMNFLASFVLLLTESGLSSQSLVFESLSALTTTGLSYGITPMLSIAGKIIIAVCMFIGRLGPLTIGVLIVSAAGKHTASKITYPEGNIMIG